MKVGLVGYQGGGKSTVFELLTGVSPDPAKTHSGQVGVATVPDERFDRLVSLYQPKKTVPAKIELFDTPGLSRDDQSLNTQRLGVIREAGILVQVVGAFSGSDSVAEVSAFVADLVLADLQVVGNRIARLKKDVIKPRPDRDDLRAELLALEPVAACLDNGQPTCDMDLSQRQEQAVKFFSLLTRKRRLVLLNTADSEFDSAVIEQLEAAGHPVIAAPAGLELEVEALADDERAEFAAAMGLAEPSRVRLLHKIFEVTNQITFYTCADKEVHAWLLQNGSTVLEAADSVHSDLARGFVRAEIFSSDDLLRLGSERELKAAGLQQVVGKDYIVRDGDDVFIRSGV
jgi:hypothetical protein